MTLSSLTYLVFLGICLVLYRLCPRSFKNFLLLSTSAAFFFFVSPAHAAVMLILGLGVYGLGLAAPGKKWPAALGIALGVGMLVLCKYLRFFASLFRIAPEGGLFSLAAPLGLSYVVFQCIAYLAEVRKGSIPPENDPVKLLLYLLFFPKLTAGPIEPPAAFLAQLDRPGQPEDVGRAFLTVAMGFVKKMAVADVAAPWVNALYSQTDPTGWMSLLAMVLYAIQIYYDFSGYTDIARGSAALFGIRLTENFNSPYRATSIRDFWKRWHISLTAWLRRYVYFPLGGSRVAPWKRYRNVLAVFLVSGLWHGANWTYVVWGLIHGLLQVAEMAATPTGKRLRRKEPGKARILLAWLRTMVLVCVSWVFFRAPSLGAAFRLLGGLLGPWGSPAAAAACCGLEWAAVPAMLAGMLFAGQLRRVLNREERIPLIPTLALCAAAGWSVALVYLVQAGSGITSSFIYFEF